jgi:hypothetical protein
VVAILDRGEGSGIAVPVRTRAAGEKQTMPRRGTCWTVARASHVSSGHRRSRDEAADGLCRKGASAVDQMCGVAIARKLWFQGAV